MDPTKTNFKDRVATLMAAAANEPLDIDQPRQIAATIMNTRPIPTPGRVTVPTVPMPGKVPVPTVPMPGRVPVPTVPTPGKVPTVPIPGKVPVPTAPTPGKVTVPTVPMPGKVTVPTVPTPGKVTVPTVPMPGKVPVPTVPTPGKVTVPTVPTVHTPGRVPVTIPPLARVPVTIPPPGQLRTPTVPVTILEQGPPPAETPTAIQLLNRNYPNHMTAPQSSNFLTIIRRNKFINRHIVDENNAVVIITPHKIILKKNLNITGVLDPTDGTLSFNAVDERRILKLQGNWIVTPLNNFPNGRPGGVIARLPYRLFPRLRIGSNWEVIIDNPIITYPGPVRLNPEGYIIQDDPNPDEFQFSTTDYNSSFFQASIETSRSVHPSLETMIQAAEAIGVLPELRNRNQFGSYLRDATFFEVNRIYKGSRVEAARKFMECMHQASINFEIEIKYKLDVERFTPNQIQQLRNYMRERHYEWTYLGFVNINHPAGQARLVTTELTPEMFLTALTPEQTILMDAWRDKVLHTGVATQPLKNLLGLRDIAQTTGYYNAPTLTNVGFRLDKITEKIPYNLIVNDIRNPGELAVSRHGRDITQKLFFSSDEMSKSYYMMLYYEAIRRNIPLRQRRTRGYYYHPDDMD